MRPRELSDKKRILVLESAVKRATGDVYNITQTGTPGAGAFLTGGNSFGATAILGTNDNNDLQIERNNSTVATFGSTALRTRSGLYTFNVGITLPWIGDAMNCTRLYPTLSADL